ncbi:MAG: hypothetical protein K5859_08940 [Atopobiaceae bacterium]|nr:hypothetical protein [Atopobiaceae bacterium]
MIRTSSVKLTTLPAVAYREKLAKGGSGIVIVRSDATQPGIASISKTSGEPIPSANTSADLYPVEAFKEAMELTAGMPYRKQGKPKPVLIEVPEEEVPEIEVVVDSSEYQAVVDAYTDKNGKLSYALLNKDLIQFVHRSSVARRMIAAGEPEEAIRAYAVGAKFRTITGNGDLTDEQALKMAELLDEVSPKGVFKELNAEIRAKLGKGKKK